MSRTSLIGRPRPSASRPSARSESRRRVEEPAHPTPAVGITTYPLRGLEERVAAFIVKGKPVVAITAQAFDARERSPFFPVPIA